MSEPLTAERLAAIADRAAHAYEYDPSEQAEVLAGTDVPALLAEVERLRAERSELNQMIRSSNQVAVTARAEVERLRAELAARPTRAEVLRETANNWTAHCPDHSNDTDEVWMDCPCYWTGELRRAADEAEAGEST